MADDELFDASDYTDDTYDETSESGEPGQPGISEPDGEAAMTNLTNLTNLTFFGGHIERNDTGTAPRLGGEGATEPQAGPLSSEAALPEQTKDWQSLSREDLDALVSQLNPELRKRYWELHSDYRVRHYPYLDARRWAWWELQRELNSRERPVSG